MLRKNLDDLEKNGIKGDWCFTNNEELIALLYENTKESVFTGLVILPISENIMPGKPHWKWNGNREQPTLESSILVRGNPNWSEGWRGFLRDGALVNA